MNNNYSDHPQYITYVAGEKRCTVLKRRDIAGVGRFQCQVVLLHILTSNYPHDFNAIDHNIRKGIS